MKLSIYKIILIFVLTFFADLDVFSQDVFFVKNADQLHLKNNSFSFPIQVTESVRGWIKVFTGEKRAYLTEKLEKFSRDSGAIKEIFTDYDLPEDLAYLYLLSSVSNRSWDILYSDKLFYLRNDWYLDERKDLLKATMVTAEYLSNAFEESNDWNVVLKDFFQLGSKYSSRDAHAVDEFFALLIVVKNLSSFGFNELKFRPPLNFVEVSLKPFTDIELISKMMNVPFEKIKKLNPELKHWFTPSNLKGYYLRIPPESLQKFEQCCRNIQSDDSFEEITIINNQSLASVAAIFKLPAYVLADLNHISSKKILEKGMVVKLPFRKTGDVSIAALYANLMKSEMPKKLNAKSARPKAAPVKAEVRTYKVKRGDTLYKIARKLKLNVKKILKDNKLLSLKTKLKVGSVIVIK